MQEMQVRSLGGEDPLEEVMATHSSIFAWEIPWTEEPGGRQSMGSQKSRARLNAHTCACRKQEHSTRGEVTLTYYIKACSLSFGLYKFLFPGLVVGSGAAGGEEKGFPLSEPFICTWHLKLTEDSLGSEEVGFISTWHE